MTNETKKSDTELFNRYVAGDKSAFKEIVNRYKDILYVFLRRFLNQHDLVEEVFQETFLQLYKSKDKFDPEKALRPWLFTIAANKAKDALRKQKRSSAIAIGTIADSEKMSFNDILDTLTSDIEIGYDNLEKEETAVLVRRIIADMPENLREILILAYFNKFSYKQMAQILSIPIGTVKSRLHTAVGYFAKEWKTAFGSKKDR